VGAHRQVLIVCRALLDVLMILLVRMKGIIEILNGKHSSNNATS
jgi:hypothetical protein